jgi:Tol biopolymer transport system component
MVDRLSVELSQMRRVEQRSVRGIRSTLAGLAMVTTITGAPLGWAQQAGSNAHDATGNTPQRVFDTSPPFFIEHFNTPVQVAPDERLAVIGTRGFFTVVDVATGLTANGSIWPGLDTVTFATFGPGGELVLLGTHAGTEGWFSRGASGPVPIPLPPDALPRWSPDGRQVAYTRSHSPESGILVGPPASPHPFAVSGAISGFAWAPDSKSVIVATTDPVSGLTTLWRLDPMTGHTEAVAHDLDAAPFTSPIAVRPDGRAVYIPLASAGRPDDAVRHESHDPRRYLRIYEVDLASGERRVVASAPGDGDSYAPAVAGQHLYWVRTAQDVSVVVVPIEGGVARTVLPDAMVPAWRPDGRQIAFVHADFRQADWGLNLDVAVVDVDAAGHSLGAGRPFIVGWGEDFVPAWSPDGRWVAYHSHRSVKPTPYYMAPGRSDDIWLRRVGAPPRDTSEIRLTDFGWECGWQTWSRDGKRLVFMSWEKGGPPGVSHAYVITIDPATGRALSHSRLSLPESMTNTPWAAWSPLSDDVGVIQDLGGERATLWVVPSAGGAPRHVVDYETTTTMSLAGWTPDGKGFVYSAKSGGTMQLFRIAADGGQARQLTHDDGNLLEPTVSASGSLIAATRIVRHEQIWRAPLPPSDAGH